MRSRERRADEEARELGCDVRIVNAALAEDLDLGRPVEIELGGGDRRAKGLYCLDRVELEGVDVVVDLNEPLSGFPDNSVEFVYGRHVIEHVEQLDQLMRELHRITRPTGRVELIVPHFTNPYHHSDPTHVRTFGLYSMHYYVAKEKQPGFRKVPAFYTDVRFELESARIEFYRSGPMDFLIAPWLEPLVNVDPLAQDWYERRLSPFFHAWQLRFVLRPDKA